MLSYTKNFVYLRTGIGKYVLVHAPFMKFQYISAAVKSAFIKINVFDGGT